MRKFIFLAFVFVIVAVSVKSFAFVIPENDSKTEYLYVIGPKGDPKKGAEDHKQVLHIDVPADTEREILIYVYDPDTGGDLDAKRSRTNPWNTNTEISVSGKGGKTLEKKEFGELGYDSQFYKFRPFSKTEAKDMGGFFRFTLDVTATSGDDANLFKVKILPDKVRVSSPNITFRLLPKKGAQMYFYPLIPEGTDKIFVENYDLDIDGGSSLLRDLKNNQEFSVNDSESGEWSKTEIALSSTNERYVDYVITKATQIDAHAGLKISDANGNPIPIYFRKKEAPVSESKCNEFTFDATSSYDPDNQALSFLWDFGDGTTSDKPVVTHTFENGGDYNVILSVTDNSGLECDTASAVHSIYINTPPVAAFSAPDISCVNQLINFDASSTTDDTPGQVSYKWNFGDGTTGEGQQVTKAFEKGGTYNVNLSVNDNSGTSCDSDKVAQTITINTPPVANAGDDVNLCLSHDKDYTISFNGSGSRDADNDTLVYTWDFGDGSGDTGVNVTHVYDSRGEYVVTLSVEDGSGSACSTDTDSLNVKINKQPVAKAGNNSIICLGTEVMFDGSGTIGEEGEELTYDWDFGDGTTGSGVQAAHTYSTGGNYKTVLTVNDGESTECSISSDSVFVKVNTQPSALISSVDKECTGTSITFDGSGSTDSDGDNLTYSWDFGDGNGDTGDKVTHAYNKSGEYVVTLTVDDKAGSTCDIDTESVNIEINEPPVAVAGDNSLVCLGTEVIFDGSRTISEEGEELTYDWNFGDGTTGSGVQVAHTYATGGSYKTVLTVNDGQSTRCSISADTVFVTVNSQPSAQLNSVDMVCTGDTVSLDASSTNDPDNDTLTYTWDFGDGTTENSGAKVTHVYNKGGSYPVKLVIDDNKGTECSQDMTDIVVQVNTPPVADAGSNLVCCLDKVTEFSASSSFDADGDNLSYVWDFGDSTTAVGENVSHAYSSTGEFLVVLTVNDGTGTKCDTATDSFTAIVNAKPTPIIKIR